MLVEITGANKMYTTKRYKRAHSVLNLKVFKYVFGKWNDIRKCWIFFFNFLHIVRFRYIFTFIYIYIYIYIYINVCVCVCV